VNTGSETHSRGTLTGGKDGAVGSFFDVFEDLGFRGTGVTKEEDVDVTADGKFSVDVFGNAAEEGHCHGGLNVFMAVDTWRNGVDDLLSECAFKLGEYSLGNVGISAESFDFTFIVFA
jgi:hypothetical protein